MKITVATNESGKIIGFSYEAASAKADPKSVTDFSRVKGQTVHEVELTPALLAHVGKDSFVEEVFAHTLLVTEKQAALQRAKK